MSWDPSKGMGMRFLKTYWPSHILIARIILDDYLLLAWYLLLKLARKQVIWFSTVGLWLDILPHEIYILVLNTKKMALCASWNGHISIKYIIDSIHMSSLGCYKKFYTPQNLQQLTHWEIHHRPPPHSSLLGLIFLHLFLFIQVVEVNL